MLFLLTHTLLWYNKHVVRQGGAKMIGNNFTPIFTFRLQPKQNERFSRNQFRLCNIWLIYSSSLTRCSSVYNRFMFSFLIKIPFRFHLILNLRSNETKTHFRSEEQQRNGSCNYYEPLEKPKWTLTKKPIITALYYAIAFTATTESNNCGEPVGGGGGEKHGPKKQKKLTPEFRFLTFAVLVAICDWRRLSIGDWTV